MATVAQVLKQALQEILTQASEAPLEADEYQDAIFVLNTMMNEFEGNGLNLGWSDVSNLADEITSPASINSSIVSNVAIRLAPQFMGSVTPELMRKAELGLKIMAKVGISIEPTEFANTLPIGSGNSRQYGSKYYEGAE